MKPKRSPPYSKSLMDLVSIGERSFSEVKIIIGSQAWEYAKIDEVRPRLLLPPGLSPDEFSWPVKNIECLIVQAGEFDEPILLRLVRRLLISGSTVVRVLNKESGLVVFRQGNTHDAA